MSPDNVAYFMKKTASARNASARKYRTRYILINFVIRGLFICTVTECRDPCSLNYRKLCGLK
jgi:hypothetical protein